MALQQPKARSPDRFYLPRSSERPRPAWDCIGGNIVFTLPGMCRRWPGARRLRGAGSALLIWAAKRQSLYRRHGRAGALSWIAEVQKPPPVQGWRFPASSKRQLACRTESRAQNPAKLVPARRADACDKYGRLKVQYGNARGCERLFRRAIARRANDKTTPAPPGRSGWEDNAAVLRRQHRRAIAWRTPICSPCLTASKLANGRTKRSSACILSITSYSASISQSLAGRASGAGASLRPRCARVLQMAVYATSGAWVGVLAALQRQRQPPCARMYSVVPTPWRVSVFSWVARSVWWPNTSPAARRPAHGGQPAFDKAVHPQPHRQRLLLFGKGKRLQRAVVIARGPIKANGTPGARNECKSSSTSCAASCGHSQLAMWSSNSCGASVGARLRFRLRSPALHLVVKPADW